MEFASNVVEPEHEGFTSAYKKNPKNHKNQTTKKKQKQNTRCKLNQKENRKTTIEISYEKGYCAYERHHVSGHLIFHPC